LIAPRLKKLRQVTGFVAALLAAASGSSACRHQPAPQAIWVSAYLRAVKQGTVCRCPAARTSCSSSSTPAPRPRSSAFIWELSAGYRPSQQPGQRDALLQAIKTEAAGR
jgi:hypothetical protein